MLLGWSRDDHACRCGSCRRTPRRRRVAQDLCRRTLQTRFPGNFCAKLRAQAEHKALAERAGDLRQRDGRVVALATVLAASDLRDIRTGRRWCDPVLDPAVEHIDEGFHEAAKIECFRREIRQRSLSGIEVTDATDFVHAVAIAQSFWCKEPSVLTLELEEVTSIAQIKRM